MSCISTLKWTTARTTSFLIAAMFFLAATPPQAAEATNAKGAAKKTKTNETIDTKTKAFDKDIGITMVKIPDGKFMMGSCKISTNMREENEKRKFFGQLPISTGCTDPHTDTDQQDSETPMHEVSIKTFEIGKTEITLGQFKKYVGSTGNSSLLDNAFMQYNAYGDDAPVVMVSWHRAKDFIAWLNKNTGGGYRLPTEAEWEYACRAGSNLPYCGSENAEDVAWHDSNSDKKQRSIGGKRANAFGLFDMSGNVWEWTEDCWHADYSGTPAEGSARCPKGQICALESTDYSGAPADGSAWVSGSAYKILNGTLNAPVDVSVWTSGSSCDVRVLRGGSVGNAAKYSRAARRYNSAPDVRGSYIGFRLARSIKP